MNVKICATIVLKYFLMNVLFERGLREMDISLTLRLFCASARIGSYLGLMCGLAVMKAISHLSVVECNLIGGQIWMCGSRFSVVFA